MPLAGFSPRTSFAKIGPRGISMPPPIKPAPKAAQTARTTGLTKINSQPSRNSLIVDDKSRRGFFLGEVSEIER